MDSPRIQPETRTACVPLKVANTGRSLERYRDGARPDAMPWREEYADSLSASGFSHHIAGPNKRPGCDLPLALSALYPERIYLRGPGGSDVELYGDRLREAWSGDGEASPATEAQPSGERGLPTNPDGAERGG